MQKIKENIFIWGLSIFAASFFFGLAVNSIAFVLFVCVSLMNLNNQSFNRGVIKELYKNKYFFSGLFFYVVQLLLVLFLSNNNAGYDKLRNLLPLLIIPLFLFLNRKEIKKRNIDAIFISFIVGSIINLVVNFTFAIYRGLILPDKINSIYFTYDLFAEAFRIQPIYLSIYYLLSIVFLISFYDRIKNKKLRILWVFIIFFLFLGLILLSARMTMLISFIVIPLNLYFTLRKKVKVITFTFGIYIFFAGLVFFNPNIKERFLSVNKEVSNYSGIKLRQKLWSKSINVIEESPIYGYSLGNYEEELIKEYKKTNFRRAIRNKYNSHNQYIQTVLVSGFIGLFFIIYLFFGSIVKIIKSRDYTYLQFIIIIVLSAVTESIFQRQFGIMLFSFMNFLFYTYLMEETNFMNRK